MPRLVALILIMTLALVAGAHANPLGIDPLNPSGSAPAENTPVRAPQPLPQAEALIQDVPVFGSHLFTGAFTEVQFTGFNPDYHISIGDQIRLRMWGAFTHDDVVVADPQGNIFIPNVGPVNVLGVRNADLNAHVERQIMRVYRSNVGVYVNLEAAQPVRVFVTGFVRQPGLYGGLSSDSVLYYIDKAGGIDPARGSFLDISVLRGGEQRAHFNLYEFMLDGSIGVLQLLDGDTLVVGPRRHTVRVSGEVVNPYQFEFTTDRIPAGELLALARPRPSATHLSIVRRVGTERRSEYFPIGEAAEVFIEDGDEVAVMADRYPGTILVRVEGAHLGEHMLVLPYGSRLKDALARIKPAPQANSEAAQIFRRSVAERQREMLENTLRSLETYVLTARSSTNEEATLRTREAELILQFVERARNVRFKGLVVLAGEGEAAESLLEDGDIIRIPETSSIVMVHGEVLFPNAVIHDRKLKVNDYIRQAGGYTQNADRSRIIVLHQNGSFTEGARTSLVPGDEIMVLPKVDTKRIETTRGITQIIYQIAVAARIAVGL
jgi:protein involved in polysaccharide export with SLBB domain